MNVNQCISSKKPLTNDTGCVKFLCPSCGKHEIMRSKKARQTCMKYECPECGFTGPN